MDELEITQPEENLEAAESTERAEDQALEDATHEPGAHVEDTQIIEQAEAVEEALTEAMEAEEEIPPAESGPDRKDLPDGSGILEEPGETVEMAEKPGEPGPANIAEVPEGIEFELASEDGTVDRNDDGLIKDPDLSETSGDKDDDDGKDATPINLPGPVAAVELSPDDVKVGGGEQLGTLPIPIPQPTSEDDGGAYIEQQPDPSPDPKGELAKDHPGPGGMVEDTPASDGNVAATPINIPKPGGDVSATPINIPKPGDDIAGHKEPGDPPPPPDLRGQTELSPDDVKLEDNLQPAPDFEAMNPSEQSVVEIISKAISNEEYRGILFADAREATAGYEVTDEDQSALGEMTEEAFNFFAAEVESRFVAATTGISEAAKQQVLTQVVHAVWRDLNPGSLVYVLTYKIPQKHLS